MKNGKVIALIGIGSYILEVLASAQDPSGDYIAPSIFIVLSGLANLVFLIKATKYLWKDAKEVSIALIASEILLWIFTTIEAVTLPTYGSLIIILTNITKVVHFLAFLYSINLLWVMEKYSNEKEKRSLL